MGDPPSPSSTPMSSVIDTDSPLLASATVTLTNPQALDSLTFNGPPLGGIIVSGSGTSVITLTGAASAADYQTALLRIRSTTPTPILRPKPASSTWSSTMERPQATWRTRSSRSPKSTTSPSVNLDANDSTVVGTSFRATFTEGGVPIPIADIDTLITDADSTTLASATITLTDPQAGDLLAASRRAAGRSSWLLHARAPESRRFPGSPRSPTMRRPWKRSASAQPARIRSQAAASSKSWSTTEQTTARPRPRF